MKENEICKSRLLVKFVIDAAQSPVVIVAVFEKSTLFDFYFSFRAPAANAPQSTWKLIMQSPMTFGRVTTIDEAVQAEARRNFPGKIVWTTPQWNITREQFNDFQERLVREDARRQEEKRRAGAQERPLPKKKGFYFNARNREFDTLAVPSGEIHVYFDWCPDCGTKHVIAHYSNGTTKCLGVQQLKSHPALEYAGHNTHTQTFTFKYKVQDVSQ